MSGETSTSSCIEPGPALEEMLRRVEERVGAGEPVAAEAVLALVACIRELIRDREALLEDVEALELSAGGRAIR